MKEVSDTFFAREGVDWKSIGISDLISRSLSSVGIDRPSLVQAACIPSKLSEKDVVIVAETGSGKTYAYLVPLFEKLSIVPNNNAEKGHIEKKYSRHQPRKMKSPDRQNLPPKNYITLLKDFPKDLVFLKRGQLLAFYMGRPDLFLNLVEQALPDNQEESYIHGMLAFPLLELGRMGEAEEAAKKGLVINKHDLWAQHCLCHVLQHKCRFKEAVEFMEECSPSWNSSSSFMLTHNWWHVALCYLEGHAPIRIVLEVYDNCIWKELERPDASYLEVYVNALGLLLRVYVRGEHHAFEDRLKTIVGRITDQSMWYLEWHLDMLIIWALACTCEAAKTEELLNGLKSRIAKKSTKKQELMKRGISLWSKDQNFGAFSAWICFNVTMEDIVINDVSNPILIEQQY